MSTTFDAQVDQLSWTCPTEYRPAVRHSIAGSATLAGSPSAIEGLPTLRVTPEIIRAATARAHAARNASFRRLFSQVFRRLFSRPSIANIEL